MVDMIQQLKQQGGARRGRKEKNPWTLNEVLACYHMAVKENYSRKQIADVTGRTVHNIQNKILEGPVKSGAKIYKRSYKAKCESISDLYKLFGEDPPVGEALEKDIETRVERYKQSRLEAKGA